MPSDKWVIPLRQRLPWGHWEQQKFYVHPGTKLNFPIEIGVDKPFELHLGSESCLSLVDTGQTFTCCLEQNACLYHSGAPKNAHFILGKSATLIHKDVVSLPVLTISEIQIELMQAEARVNWNDGIQLQKEERYQQSIQIEHWAPNTHSECCLKSIIQEQGFLNFVCDIFIHENAHKSTAHQKNLNHVLSPQGRVTALPRLHIFNKNVEASHGTATQPISEETLFYLRTRGLSLREAEQLYLESFFQDCYLHNTYDDEG